MPEANLFIERRVHPRISLRIPIQYRVIEDQNEIKTVQDRNVNEQNKHSHTMDVSLGGLYLVADHVLPVGSLLRLEITFPKNSRIISAYAEVVWSNNTGGGLHFQAMKEEDEEALKTYLSKIPSKNLNK
jgi:c-di-GMP-binding flagellar brake protein YcgR